MAVTQMIEFVVRYDPERNTLEKVEGVVRCGDCTHMTEPEPKCYWCDEWNNSTGLNEFCSFAEGKGEDG